MTSQPHLLASLIVLPLLMAGIVALAPKGDAKSARTIAFFGSVATLLLSLVALKAFVVGDPNFQITETLPWIRAFGANFSLGIDGISLWLVILNALLYPICILASWHQTKDAKLFFSCLLAIEAAVMGVFLATDLLLFYVFWEAVLVPMYFLIGVFGGQRRVYATIKFFLFTLFGGLLMLVAIIVLHVKGSELVGVTFDYTSLASAAKLLDPGTQTWLFAAFTFAFAIKIPLIGVHTWLPDAHTEAPTAGSVVLAGVLLKMGTYGLLRFSIPMFPAIALRYAPLMIAIAVLGILYGSAVSVVQSDVKRLIAYSSVSHLGFVVLGLFALTLQASEGAMLQMINHGLSTPLLFLLFGMLYERRHTRKIADFGGVRNSAPVLAGLFLFACFASLGLPGLNGFVGEFLVLIGTFNTHPLAASFASFGVVITALYLLWLYQRVFTGPITSEENASMSDLGTREKLLVAPLVALIIFIGVKPQPFLERIEPSIKRAYAGIVELPQNTQLEPKK